MFTARSISTGLLAMAMALTSYSQTRSNSHYLISTDDGYDLGRLSGKDTLRAYICGARLRAVVSTDLCGSIVVDFMSIRRDARHPDLYRDSSNCVSSATPASARFVLLPHTHGTLGDRPHVLRLPLRGHQFGVSTYAMRLRAATDALPPRVVINPSVAVNYCWSWGYGAVSNHGVNNYTLALGPIMGVAAVDVSRSYLSDPSKWRYDHLNPALTYGFCAVFARNRLGLLLSVGADRSFGPDSSVWIYQDHLWFGIGVSTT